MLSPGLAALGLLGMLALAGGAALADDQDQGKARPKEAKANPVVVLDTSQGKITVELYPEKAPKTVANFLKYADDGFYKDTIFHRVIGPSPQQPEGFMIQGGGIGTDNKEKKTREPVENESGNGLSNTKGMVAMARKPDPNSATAQFYINLGDNSRLDNYAGGYTVFGKVVDGLDVVDKIARVKTGIGALELIGPTGALMRRNEPDVPVEPVVLKGVTRKEKTSK